ncbi:MAG: 6-bladed beta-propeller, partial [Clostridiaceae bacterium]|nr:6-bladed beta-propeller [Clostridiaceae bacterium]
MKIKIFFLTVVAVCLLHGCNGKVEKGTTGVIPIKLDLKKEMRSIHDIDLIKDVEVINLDCDEVLIGEIDKVIKFDSIIYLMDKKQNRSIYLFNLNGDFIQVISKYGNGPEEYMQLTDMFINAEDSTLNIVSRIDNKLFKYDLRGENLVAIEKIPKSFTSLIKIDKGYVGYMNNWSQDPKEPYNVWSMNNKMELTGHYFEIDKAWGSRGIDSDVFSNYRNNYYCIMPMDYNIYSITTEDLEVKYSFDLGSFQWPNVSESEIQDNDKRRELVNKYVHRFYNFQETENHLIVQFLYKNQYLLGTYNKIKEETNIVELSAYTGKYFFSFGNIISFDEKTIYTTIEASNMKRI